MILNYFQQWPLHLGWDLIAGGELFLITAALTADAMGRSLLALMEGTLWRVQYGVLLIVSILMLLLSSTLFVRVTAGLLSERKDTLNAVRGSFNRGNAAELEKR